MKSLTRQVISKALLLLSFIEDDHNYILTQLKKNQFIRSPELCMVHKRHTMVYLYIFFYIILNFAMLFYRQMLKIHLQLALCLHSECSQPGGGGR